MSRLPSSWAEAPLGDLLTEVWGGGTPDKSKAEYFRGDIPFMTVKDMHSRFIDDTQDHISQEGLASSASRVVPADTLVIASRMSLGKIARPTHAVAINQDLKALFLREGVSKAYIEYTWLANAGRIQAMGTGTTVKGIRLEDIRGLVVPVAPAAEQTRIANQLDTLLARIQACQDRLEAIPALLKRFRQAVLNAAITGSLSQPWRDSQPKTGSASGLPSWATSMGLHALPSGWRWARFAECLEGLRSGTSAVPTSSPTQYPVLRSSSVRPMGINLGDVRYLASLNKVRADDLLAEGDLLFTRLSGSLDYVANCVFVRGLGERQIYYPDRLFRARLKDPTLGPYVELCFSSSLLRRHLTVESKSTAGHQRISMGAIRDFPIPLPGDDEQLAIGETVGALLGFAARVEQRLDRATAVSHRLAPLTLAKAFRGELVPQDPTDEPASELLARIAAVRSLPATTSRPRSPRTGRPPRAPKEIAAMTKSRQDTDVMGQPYLAGHLRRLGTPARAEALFKVAELPVADFYKQLAWEVAQGHVKDNQTTLEPGHAAG